MTGLSDLPDDALIAVVCNLSPSDILTLRKVGTFIARVTYFKALWIYVIQNYLAPLGCSPPSYCKDLDDLSSHQTELLALHLLRSRRRIDGNTKPVATVSLPQSRSVTWLRIIGGQWLVVAASSQSKSTIVLWSLRQLLATPGSESAPAPVAQGYLDGPVSGGEVCSEHGEMTIALDIHTPLPSIQILKVIEDGETLFAHAGTYRNMSRIRAVYGHLIGYALQEESSVPYILDWQTGVVHKLRCSASPAGGCMAMAIQDGTVAVVTPASLEVYSLSSSGESLGTPRRIGHCDLPVTGLIGYAAVSFDSQHQAGSLLHIIRVCVSSDQGLCVLEAAVIGNQTFSLALRATFSYQPQQHVDILRPSFGERFTTLSWFEGHQRNFQPVSFVVSTLPVPSSLADVDIDDASCRSLSASLVMADWDMPALYAMCVRDFDEARGVAAFGNAFGELVLYDFTGTDSEELESCFHSVELSPRLSRDVLPLSSRRFRSAYPFPYGGPPVPSREDALRITDGWKSQWPINRPLEWEGVDVEVRDTDEYCPWMEYLPIIGELGWEIEHGLHLYGSVVPLLQRDIPWFKTFKIGDQLVLEDCEEYPKVFYILPPTLNPFEIADIVAFGQLEEVSLSRTSIPCLVYNEAMRYRYLWEWEWMDRGRNRWQELKDRGGEVDPYWTADWNKPTEVFTGHESDNTVGATELTGWDPSNIDPNEPSLRYFEDYLYPELNRSNRETELHETE